MSFLVDTNVLSEPRQKHPDPTVVEWLRENQSNLYTSVLVIGELRYGIERLPAVARRADLGRWLDRLIRVMAGRVISVNLRIAEEWARLNKQMDRKGVVVPALDVLLAATARRHKLVRATDNVRDFENTGVRVINPFLA